VVLLSERSGRDEAVRAARQLASTYAATVVTPALTDGVLELEPGARVAFEQEVAPRLVGSPMSRIKIWRADGTVVYSDEPRLVGQQFALDEADLEVLVNGGAEAEISEVSRAENVFEHADATVLEVYEQLTTPSGQHALFEVYMPYSAVQAEGRAIWWAFAPVVIAALAFLWLVQLPSAWSMARQIRAGQADRERLLRRALDASDAERRRIATELHNGAVQTMAGVSYALGAVDQELPDQTPPQVRDRLDEASAATRASIRELRALLVDIYPPRLRQAGLESALSDLVSPLQSRGVATDLTVSLPDRPPADIEAVLYRTAQEALRNVSDHAGAERVSVELVGDHASWRLVVIDDGCGIDPSREALLATDAPLDPDGHHLGLRLLGELAADVDGELHVRTAIEGGTRVDLLIPVGVTT
jgi:signal transduction histidine kinase